MLKMAIQKNIKNIAYKILTVTEFEKFAKDKVFIGTPLDIKDGYIHMSSTKEQMERVKQKYYKDQKIYLLEIDLDKLNNVKFEPISNGDIYPHLYGDLKIDDVISYKLK
jgi:uncharacterized protein (DUF952 family)